jgi:hypothetical protein
MSTSPFKTDVSSEKVLHWRAGAKIPVAQNVTGSRYQPVGWVERSDTHRLTVDAAQRPSLLRRAGPMSNQVHVTVPTPVATGITSRMNATDAAGHFCCQCQQQLIMKTFGACSPGSCDILAKRKAVVR